MALFCSGAEKPEVFQKHLDNDFRQRVEAQALWVSPGTITLMLLWCCSEEVALTPVSLSSLLLSQGSHTHIQSWVSSTLSHVKAYAHTPQTHIYMHFLDWSVRSQVLRSSKTICISVWIIISSAKHVNIMEGGGRWGDADNRFGSYYFPKFM